MPVCALVIDERRGRRTELLRRRVEVARAEGVATISADIRADNVRGRRALEKAGFAIVPGATDDLVRVEMRLA
jgi:hypothetical protein